MKKDVISIDYWREGHLLPLNCVTDAFYVKYARKLRDQLRTLDTEKRIPGDLANEIAISLAYYIEDVVSGLGMWQSFTTLCHKMYGRYLPFYPCAEDSYYPDEVNRQDVAFLIWMLLQKNNASMIMNPENDLLLYIADALYSQMDADFEHFPINNQLLEAVKNPRIYEDFFLLKSFLVQMNCMTYLFYYFTLMHREKAVRQIEHIVSDYQGPSVIEYMSESLLAIHEKTGPLALYPQEWLQQMLLSWGYEKQAADVAQMEARDIAPYRILGMEGTMLQLADWEDRQYSLQLQDLQLNRDADLSKQEVLFGALVCYRGVWYPNGGVTWSRNRSDFERYQKDKQAFRDHCREQYHQVMAANHQSPLLFFRNNDEMSVWAQQYLNMTPDQLHPRSGEGQEEYLAVFASETDGVLVVPQAALAICHPDNPYYDAVQAQDKVIDLLFDMRISRSDFLHYLVTHHLLPDAALLSEKSPEEGRRLLQDNMDFMLRCIRSDY